MEKLTENVESAKQEISQAKEKVFTWLSKSVSKAGEQVQEMGENVLKKFRDDHTKTFKELTAAQFLEVWSNYDGDGNGYIEDKELEKFIHDLLASYGTPEKDITQEALTKLKNEFMEKYDTNKDSKIEIKELSHLLPMEESFLLLFRRDYQLEKSQDFMRIWKKFDQNGNGYIEKDELEVFIGDLFSAHKKEISKEKVKEYSSIVMKMFDVNGDGQLSISEMAKLLPVKENYLVNPKLKIQKKITIKDLDEVFKNYDTDGSGEIDGLELDGFLKDLFEMTRQTYHVTDLDDFKTNVMKTCDVNGDGNIQRDELTIIMLQFSNMAIEKK